VHFDEFVQANQLHVAPVEQCEGLQVEVGLPPDWDPFQSSPGMRIWVWRNDPCRETFCANAVLTMNRVDSPLDPAAVFTMLCGQQVHALPDSQELRRELAAATEGPGVTGVFDMSITAEVGRVDSLSLSRIVADDQRTWITQLTVTALADSPVDRTGIWLRIRTVGGAIDPESIAQPGAPLAGSEGGRR
jgi:hypothetical protein